MGVCCCKKYRIQGAQTEPVEKPKLIYSRGDNTRKILKKDIFYGEKGSKSSSSVLGVKSLSRKQEDNSSQEDQQCSNKRNLAESLQLRNEIIASALKTSDKKEEAEFKKILRQNSSKSNNGSIKELSNRNLEQKMIKLIPSSRRLPGLFVAAKEIKSFKNPEGFTPPKSSSRPFLNDNLVSSSLPREKEKRYKFIQNPKDSSLARVGHFQSKVNSSLSSPEQKESSNHLKALFEVFRSKLVPIKIAQAEEVAERKLSHPLASSDYENSKFSSPLVNQPINEYKKNSTIQSKNRVYEIMKRKSKTDIDKDSPKKNKPKRRVIIQGSAQVKRGYDTYRQRLSQDQAKSNQGKYIFSSNSPLSSKASGKALPAGMGVGGQSTQSWGGGGPPQTPFPQYLGPESQRSNPSSRSPPSNGHRTHPLGSMDPSQNLPSQSTALSRPFIPPKRSKINDSSISAITEHYSDENDSVDNRSLCVKNRTPHPLPHELRKRNMTDYRERDQVGSGPGTFGENWDPSNRKYGSNVSKVEKVVEAIRQFIKEAQQQKEVLTLEKKASREQAPEEEILEHDAIEEKLKRHSSSSSLHRSVQPNKRPSFNKLKYFGDLFFEKDGGDISNENSEMGDYFTIFEKGSRE